MDRILTTEAPAQARTGAPRTAMSDLGSLDDSFGMPADEPARGRARKRAIRIAPVIGGVVAALVVAMKTPIGAWLRGFVSRRPKPAITGGTSLLDRGLPLPLIRDSILGRGKTAVAASYGPPRTAGESLPAPAPAQTSRARAPRAPRRQDFWNADIWYYPIDTRTQTAMAVHFQNGIARAVDFIQTPRLTDAP